MFDYLFHPYLRWLHNRSQNAGPNFNFHQIGLPARPRLPNIVKFSTPEPQPLYPSPPLTGLAGFIPKQPTEVPGFNVGWRSDVPSFNDTDMLPLERGSPSEFRGIAKTSTLPTGAETTEPTQRLLQWLYNTCTMPAPRLSTAFDPQMASRRESLIHQVRHYPTSDDSVQKTGAVDGYEHQFGTMPSPSSLQGPAIKQRPPPELFGTPADIDISADSAHRIKQETGRSSDDGQPDVHSSSATLSDTWGAVAQPWQQRKPLLQEQWQPLSNPPETAFSGDSASTQPPPVSAPSPIALSVYNPDVDSGAKQLFDLVGVKENKMQGDAARDAEAERIQKAHPSMPFEKEVRIYPKDVPSYMTADILFRPNGTSMITILEVKSGNAKLSPQQVATLTHAVRTGAIYLVNEEAAKKFGLRPYETFASKGIIPSVYVTGGNQDAIVRQLHKLGIEAVPETTRRGQVPRLRVGVPPT